MSTGHRHPSPPGIGRAAIDALEEDPELLALVQRYRRVDKEHDIPYLGGYSQDGETIYRDRGVPDVIEVTFQGRGYKIDVDRYLVIHESWEKALIDGRGWTYPAAHRVAEAIEDRAGLRDGIPPRAKAHAFAPYIKADSRERLERVPQDLDMTPYLDPPVDRRLLARMRKAQGLDGGKETKEEAQYTTQGTPAEHCGRAWEWPAKGECRHFTEPSECRKVLGFISPRGWCRNWEAQKKKREKAEGPTALIVGVGR